MKETQRGHIRIESRLPESLRGSDLYHQVAERQIWQSWIRRFKVGCLFR